MLDPDPDEMNADPQPWLKNMENWFVQSAVRSLRTEQGLVITCCTTDTRRGVGRIWRGVPTRVQRILLFLENEEYTPFDGCKIEILDTFTK